MQNNFQTSFDNKKFIQSYPPDFIIFVEPNINHHEHFKLSSIEKSQEKADIHFILVAHREFEDISFSKKVISFVGQNNFEKK
jgi:UDP-N-acetyl-D-mannosaminuronic acid dehydrogenase